MIGEGGMGIVYEAEQEHPRRNVALKVIKPVLPNSKMLRRFQQEAQALGRLQHPGIAQIYEAGMADVGAGSQPYFAMEFVRGQSLREYAESHRLDTRHRLELIAKVCDAVQHAHQRGLIHRDLKPGNILVDETGQPKILDFGVVRLIGRDAATTIQTNVGQLVGTLAYMSPEQVLADPLELDTRSDVYALGVILFELLAGRLPYNIGKQIHEAVRAITEDDPSRLSLISPAYRGDIETIAAKALEKDKTRRYGSAAEMAADITRYLKDEPIIARPASAGYHLRKFARRHKGFVGAAAVVFAVMIAAVIVSRIQVVRAREAETNARLAETRAVDANNKMTEALRKAELQEKLARLSESEMRLERQKADRAEQDARLHRDTAVWQSLARESLRLSGSRANDDLALLLARQAFLIRNRAPSEPRYLVEEALQSAMELTFLNHSFPGAERKEIASIAFSPDGSRVAVGFSAFEAVIRVWHVKNPAAPPAVLQGHRLAAVLSLAFSPDGKQLVSGGTDQTVRVWDLSDPTRMPRVFEGHQGAVLDVAFSQDGSLVSSVSTDGIVFVRNLMSQSVRVYRGPGNGTGIARGAVARSLPLDTVSLVTSGPPSMNISLSLSRDGTLLAAGGWDRSVRVWDLRRPQEPPLTLSQPRSNRTPADNVRSVKFSSDGLKLASGGDDGLVQVWSLGNPTAPPQIFRGHTGAASSVSFSPDGSSLVTSSWDRTVRVWNLQSPGANPILLAGHQDSVQEAVYSPDGFMIVSGGNDALRLWLANEFMPRPSRVFAFPPTTPGLSSVAVSPDGAWLGRSNGPIAWVLDLRNPEAQVNSLQTGGAVLRAMAFSPVDASLAGAGEDGIVRVWEPARVGPPLLLRGHRGAVLSVAFSTNGEFLASGGADGSIRVRRFRGSAEEFSLTPGAPVSALTFSSDGHTLVSSALGAVFIWNLRQPDLKPKRLELESSLQVYRVALSTDSRMLAIGTSGGVQLWDLHGTNPKLVLRNSSLGFSNVQFSRDGGWLSSGVSGGIYLWDVQNPSAEPLFLAIPQSLQPNMTIFLDNDTRLLGVWTNPELRLETWLLGKGAADHLCNRVSRNLSREEWRTYAGEGIPYEKTCPSRP
jgi:eukaryotic-like serine/threonine-protein kinase